MTGCSFCHECKIPEIQCPYGCWIEFPCKHNKQKRKVLEELRCVHNRKYCYYGEKCFYVCRPKCIEFIEQDTLKGQDEAVDFLKLCKWHRTCKSDYCIKSQKKNSDLDEEGCCSYYKGSCYGEKCRRYCTNGGHPDCSACYGSDND